MRTVPDRAAAPGAASTSAHIAWHAVQNAMAIAVVDGPLRVTYQDLAADLGRCVGWLAQAGVAPDKLAAVEVLRNRYLHLLVLLACEIIGAPTTPLLAGMPIEADPVLSCCDLLLRREMIAVSTAARTIIVPDDLLARVRTAALPHDYLAILQQPLKADRIARIVRTSGTTAWPKAIALTHGMLSQIVATAMDRVLPDVLTHCRFLCLYNFGVRGVYTKVHGVLRHGGTVFLCTEEVVPAFLSSGLVNYVIFTTGDVERVARRCGPFSDGEGPQVDLIGANASPVLKQLIRQRIGKRILVRYATNETSIVADTDEDGVNVLVPGNRVRIVDEADRDLPPGQTGLILVRTPVMASAYYNDEALSRSAFVGGWFRTNDIGYVPEEGKVVVLGRADDMLNIGGLKVAPGPLEAAIRRVPGVMDAAAVRTNDAEDVGALLVAVECAGGHIEPATDRAVRAIVSEYVRMFHLMPLPSFPRTETGKIRRDELAAAFRRRLV